jgi:hypothetical protein
MNCEPIRSRARSAANVEFHQSGERLNEIAHRILIAPGDRGVGATYPARGFSMEVDRVGTGKIWIVSHKPVAVAAGELDMGTASEEDPAAGITPIGAGFRI